MIDEPKSEANVEPKPKAKDELPSDLTPQIVKRVHEFYEELGRENVRAVEDLEKAKQGARKDEAKAEPTPEATAEPKPKPTEESKPDAKPEPEPGAKVEPKPEATAEPKKIMTKQQKKWLVAVVVILILAALGVAAWQLFGRDDKNKGLVSGNGRIEAVEIDVAAKIAGRIKDILVREGAFVTIGQVVAIMDTEVLEAQLREAKAQLQQAQSSVATARSQQTQRESEKSAAMALVRQREAELDNARKHSGRSSDLVSGGAISRQVADDDTAQLQSAAAAESSARAQVAAAEAAIATARTQIAGALSAVDAVQATVERIQADILDSALKSPRDGRVQYRVAQPREVVGAGGRVLSLVDLSDVYMTFFLPTAVAGRVALGTEVRLILDSAPQYVIPAQVSFISDVAQFTPKTVETASEREKLMFRIRAQIPVELLRKHINQVKTGLPGMAYVRLDSTMQWPAHLKVKLPQ